MCLSSVVVVWTVSHGVTVIDSLALHSSEESAAQLEITARALFTLCGSDVLQEDQRRKLWSLHNMLAWTLSEPNWIAMTFTTPVPPTPPPEVSEVQEAIGFTKAVAGCEEIIRVIKKTQNSHTHSDLIVDAMTYAISILQFAEGCVFNCRNKNAWLSF